MDKYIVVYSTTTNPTGLPTIADNLTHSKAWDMHRRNMAQGLKSEVMKQDDPYAQQLIAQRNERRAERQRWM